MKTFYKKVLIIWIAVILGWFFIGDLLHIGDTNITYVDYQVLYDLDYPQAQLNNHSLREVFEEILTDWNRELPNGVFTYEQRYDNGAYVLDRYVGEVTFTGNEVWAVDDGASQVNTIVFKYENTLIKNPTVGLIMSGFPAKTDSALYSQDSEAISFGDFMGANSFAVKILRSRLTTEDVNGFKSYLQNNPTTLYFELATPVLNVWSSALTVSQIDYWYNIYVTLKGLED